MKKLFSFFRTRGVAVFLASLVMLFATGCQRYAFPRVSPERIGKIDEGEENIKFFILHAGNNLYELTNLAMNSKVLTGKVEPVSGPIYYSASRTTPYTKAEAGVLNEVHVYLNSSYDSLALGIFSAPLSNIKEVRLIKRPSPVGPIIGVILGIGLLGLLGLHALFSSFNAGR